MEEQIKILIEEFRRISNKGWIKGDNISHGSIGLVFENELEKKPDALPFPDYYGIELKCTSRYSRYPLYLFTINFDGTGINETKRITNEYGYFDKDFTNKKIIFEKICCNNFHTSKSNYYFKYIIDDINKRLYVCIYNKNKKLLETNSYIEFRSIEEHLITKLSRPAYIHNNQKRKIVIYILNII